MAYLDGVFFRAVSNGTGDFVVASAIQGYQTPAAAGAVNAGVYGYRAESDDLTQWEYGYTTYTVSGTSCSRTVLGNSAGTTAKINFTIAPKVGFVELAEHLSKMLTTAGNDTIIGGFKVTPNSLGNITSFTLNPALGNYQYGTNHGAFTMTAPASDCAIDFRITNDASAGAITFSGMTAYPNTGALTTVNGHTFDLCIRRINGTTKYAVIPHQ